MSDNNTPPTNNSTNESSGTNIQIETDRSETTSIQNRGPPPPYERVDSVGSTSGSVAGDAPRNGPRYLPTPPYPTDGPQAFPEPPPYMPQPILEQPTSQVIDQITVGPILQPPLNCPPGLEYLTMVDQLLVHQKLEILEMFTGFETSNKYQIRNSVGQDVYFAVEDSDCLTRNCCGSIRPFDMKIYDNFRNEVIHFYRPLACDSCCFPCCLQYMSVSAPPGNFIGTIQQEWSIFFPTFAVKDATGETILRIEGPFLTCSCCCNDVKFRITSADGTKELGKITKQWSGFIREAFSDADNFGITFPMELDVTMKAVLLGGLFLIDAMFFENAGSNG